MRISRFELACVHCESGALSTEPLPRGTLSSCCAQYLCPPDSALYSIYRCIAFITLARGGTKNALGQPSLHDRLLPLTNFYAILT